MHMKTTDIFFFEIFCRKVNCGTAAENKITHSSFLSSVSLYFHFTDKRQKSPPTEPFFDYTVILGNSPFRFPFSTQKKGTLQAVEFLMVDANYFRLFLDLSLKQSQIIISAGIPSKKSSHQLYERNAT